MPVIYEDGNYLTEKGRALIAKCLAAKTDIKFTRTAIGSGAIPDGATPRSMTDLSEWKADGLIADISTPVPGEAQIVFQVFSQDVPMGFFASEGAVWANDPDEGEILYTYIVIANEPEWIRAANNPVQKFAEFTCISIVEAVPVDITQINPKSIVTADALEKRLANLGAGVVFSATRPIDDDWTLWLVDHGEIPAFGETALLLDTGPLEAPGKFAIVNDDGSGGETILNMTDDPVAAGEKDIIIAED